MDADYHLNQNGKRNIDCIEEQMIHTIELTVFPVFGSRDALARRGDELGYIAITEGYVIGEQ